MHPSSRPFASSSRPWVPNPLALAVALALWGPLTPIGAQAQTSAEADKKEGNDTQRVVVTASKRRQLQSDVAGTVTAVDGSRLERLGSTDAEDVMKLTPGVQFNKGTADNSLLSIRGVSTNSNALNQGFTQAPTGIYIEDVPFTDPFAFVSVPDLTPFDLERVEVLRGPQGALYGSSSLGGAIRYLLNKPNLRQTEGSVLAGFSQASGGGSGWSTAAMVNLPMAEGKAGLRVVVNARKDPGFIDNRGTGIQDANTNRVDGGRLLFTWQPSDRFDLTATYLQQKSRQADGSGISPFDYTTGAGYVQSYDKLDVKTAVPQRYTSSFDLGTVQANLNVGGLRLTSLTGYQTKSRIARDDFSRDFYDPAFLGDRWTNDTDMHTRTWSQEFRVAPVSPGAVSWLVGAFWMDSSVQRDQKVFLEPRGTAPDLRFRRTGQAAEAALFADAEIKLSEKLTAAAGARAYKTELEYDRITGVADPGTAIRYDSNESGTTPKLSLRYAFAPTLSGYVLASRGYRFGGISNLGSSPTGRPYKSDSLWNYEAGVRWSPSDRGSLDLSVFRIDWKDVQLAELYTDPVTNRQFLVTGNIGAAVSQGIELAAAWRPTQAFSLRSALAYTDAKTSGGITIGGAPIADGTPLPGTAKVQGTLEGTFNFAGPADSSGRFSTVIAHTGKRRAQIDSPMTLPAYTTVDLRLAFAWSQVELTAFVGNATNELGISGGVDFANPRTYTEFYPIRPRTMGVSVRYDF
jgi:outer membrane receptor protein involved in Fe transport